MICSEMCHRTVYHFDSRLHPGVVVYFDHLEVQYLAFSVDREEMSVKESGKNIVAPITGKSIVHGEFSVKSGIFSVIDNSTIKLVSFDPINQLDFIAEIKNVYITHTEHSVHYFVANRFVDWLVFDPQKTETVKI